MTAEQIRNPRVARAQFIKATSGAAAGQAMTAVLFILAARHSEVHEFGSTVALLAAAAFLTVLLDFGSNGFLIRLLASTQDATNDFASRVIAKTLIGCTIGGLGTGGVALIAPQYTNESILLSSLVVTGAVSQMAPAPIVSAARFGRASLIVVSDKAASLAVGMVVIASGGTGTVALVSGIVIGQLTSALLSACLWDAKTRRSLLSMASRPSHWLCNPWKGSFHFGTGAVALAAGGLDVVLTGALGGSAAAGAFGAVARWVQPMGLVSNGFSRSSYPAMSAATSSQGAWRELRHGWWLLCAAVAAATLLTFTAPAWIDLLIGNKYSTAAGALVWLSWGSVVASVNQPVMTFLQARHAEARASFTLICGVLVQLGLVTLLVPSMGATGAGLAFLMAQLLMLGVLANQAHSILKGQKEIGNVG